MAEQSNTSPLDLGPGSSLADILASAVETTGFWSDDVERCARICGSLDAFTLLDDHPLSDEPASLRTVPLSDSALVGDILAITDRVCDEWLDVEYRTILRRLVVVAACHPTQPLRRRTSSDRLAAALLWMAVAGNGFEGPRYRIDATTLWRGCGTTSCASLGRAIASDLGVRAPKGMDDMGYPRAPIELGDVGLLRSSFRTLLVQKRTRLAERVLRQHEDREARKPAQLRPDGRIELRTRMTPFAGTVTGTDDDGNAIVMMVFDDPDVTGGSLLGLNDPAANPEIVAVSLSDAYRLASALDNSLVRLGPPPHSTDGDVAGLRLPTPPSTVTQLRPQSFQRGNRAQRRRGGRS